MRAFERSLLICLFSPGEIAKLAMTRQVSSLFFSFQNERLIDLVSEWPLIITPRSTDRFFNNTYTFLELDRTSKLICLMTTFIHPKLQDEYFATLPSKPLSCMRRDWNYE